MHVYEWLMLIGLISFLAASIILARHNREFWREQKVDELRLKKTRRHVLFLAIITGLFAGIPFGYQQDVQASLFDQLRRMFVGVLFIGVSSAILFEMGIYRIRNPVEKPGNKNNK